uniref:ZP domain-containing protein n=1 Tax=Anguilla anguilla TaxID=7936 RepID=A0A0E9UCP8_ANGAN
MFMKRSGLLFKNTFSPFVFVDLCEHLTLFCTVYACVRHQLTGSC